MRISDNTKNYKYYNLLSGADEKLNAILKANTPSLLAFDDSENVECYKSGNIGKMRGSVKLANMTGVRLLGVHEYTKQGVKYLLAHTNEGKLYLVDSEGTWTALSTTGIYLDDTEFSVSVNYMNGIVISDGVNDLIYYEHGVGVTQCGAPFVSKCLAVFNNRLWIAGTNTDGDAELASTALGLYNDWTSNPLVDSFNVKNPLADSSEFKALAVYQSRLIVYRESQSFEIIGDDPTNYYINPVSRLCATSQRAIANAENIQVFFDAKNKGIFLQSPTQLNGIAGVNQLSDVITGAFNSIDSKRADEIIAVPYPIKNQIWFFVPERNKVGMNLVWVFHFVSTDKYVWYKRRLPYNALCACNYDGVILTGNDIGEIRQEDALPNEVEVARVYQQNKDAIDEAINNLLNFLEVNDGEIKPNACFNGIPYEVFENDYNELTPPLATTLHTMTSLGLGFLAVEQPDKAKLIADFAYLNMRYDSNEGINAFINLSKGELEAEALDNRFSIKTAMLSTCTTRINP